MQVKHEQKGAALTHSPCGSHTDTHTHSHRLTCIYGNYLSNIFTLLLVLISYLLVSYIISVPYLRASAAAAMCVCVSMFKCVCLCACVPVHVSSLILIAALAFDMQNCAQFIINGVRILYPWSGFLHFLLLLLLLLLLCRVVLYAAARWRNWNIIFRNLEREHITKCIWPLSLLLARGIRCAVLNFN